MLTKNRHNRAASPEIPPDMAPRPKSKLPSAATYAGRLALRLRARRGDAGLTIPQFADALTRAGYKIATSTVYAWENGTLDPQLNALPALAKVLHVAIADLLPPR
ncbi:MAG TPA: helix-turn-helix transcriptional regulator [Pirellulales bacterium]|jgi:DNA-binding XRE family transcriptional regulator|nr:helix-turn-helix transcriptional regulator [Pirellulales bacterium]